MCQHNEYTNDCLRDETPEDLVDKDPIKADEIHSSIVNGNLTIVLGHLKEFQPVDSNHSGFWLI